MDGIEIRLLGTFSLRYNDVPLAGFTDRQQRLLAYLSLHAGIPLARQQIAFLFWPDSSDQQAKTNLRQLLHHLRRIWPAVDRCLQLSLRTIQWQPDIPFTLDTAHFETLLQRANDEATPDRRSQLLEEAINCYQGDVLPTCYDDWILPLRGQLHQHFVQAQEVLSQAYEIQGKYQAAIHWSEHLLQSDPLDEDTYRRLIRLYALTDNRASALRVYHTCETVLRQELGVEPGPATREQYKRLLNITTPVELPFNSPTALHVSPLVGRRHELAALGQVWQTVRQGQAQVIIVHGEAGIGKTRLLDEFARWLALQGAVMARTRSYAMEGQLTYAALTAWLRSEALSDRLAALDEVWLTEVSRLLPELLVAHPQLAPPPLLTESWQRQRFYEALARAVVSETDKRPLVLILDDLQWGDGGVLEWLTYLVHFAQGTPLLIIGTVRTGVIDALHPLQSWLTALRREQLLTEVRLHPLDKSDSIALAQAIAGREFLADQLIHLYRETEGNPLFIVETVRAALEQTGELQGSAVSKSSGVTSLPSKLLPSKLLPSKVYRQSFTAKVQAVIESRLNQLSAAARDLAEYAAVIGREFAFDVLARATERTEEALVCSLDELWQRRLIREQGTTVYDFSHDKIREVVYSQISQARRRLLHRRAAEALVAVYGDNQPDISAQLAMHYEQALLPEQAIARYQQAAEMAQRVYANAEVVKLLTKALSLMNLLPSSEARDIQEVRLRVALSAPLVALSGYKAPAVMAEYRQILALCLRLRQPPDPRVLRGLAIANILQADFRQSWEYGQQILDVPQLRQNSIVLVEGHYVLGVSAFWRGEFEQSHFYLEQALAYYSPAQREEHINTYAQDAGVICAIRLAWTLWHLGYPEQAYRMMTRVLEPQAAVPHPYSQAYALVFACMLYEDAEDQERLQEQAERLAELATKTDFFYLRNWAAFHQGWIVGLNGDYAASAQQIRTAIDEWHAEQTYLLTPRMLERLAVAYWRSGRLAQGAAVLEEAWSAALQHDETYFLAELARMRGEFLLAQNGSTLEVVSCFQEAVDIAHRQDARMIELRALVSLCRIYQTAGLPDRLAATRKLLQTSYGWFSEGFAANDLQAAKTLLDELAANELV